MRFKPRNCIHGYRPKIFTFLIKNFLVVFFFLSALMLTNSSTAEAQVYGPDYVTTYSIPPPSVTVTIRDTRCTVEPIMRGTRMIGYHVECPGETAQDVFVPGEGKPTPGSMNPAFGPNYTVSRGVKKNKDGTTTKTVSVSIMNSQYTVTIAPANANGQQGLQIHGPGGGVVATVYP